MGLNLDIVETEKPLYFFEKNSNPKLKARMSWQGLNQEPQRWWSELVSNIFRSAEAQKERGLLKIICPP